MATCMLTGKRPVFGRSIQHQGGGGWFRRASKTNRLFKPNVHRQRLYVPEWGRWVVLKLSAKALRTIEKKGVLQAFRDEGLDLAQVLGEARS